MKYYKSFSKKDKLICRLTSDPAFMIDKYIRYLRLEEYFFNTSQNILGRLIYLFWLRKKNLLGNKLGFKIPHNCIGPGLSIYHNGEIIINENARIGSNCILHGGNCVGNNGKSDKTPIIGDGLEMGIGSKVIGDVLLKNQVTIGANAVVTKSFDENGITLIGIPAYKK